MPDGVIPGGPSFVGPPAAPVEPVGAPCERGRVPERSWRSRLCWGTTAAGRTATLTQVAQALAALLVDLRTHGMIGT
jgi:hypothetical protein